MSPKIDISKIGSRSTLKNDEQIVKPRFKCALDSLEIRLNDPFDGNFYCDQDIQPGTIMTSNLSTVTLLLHSFDSYTSDLKLINPVINFTVTFKRSSSTSKDHIVTSKTTTSLPLSSFSTKKSSSIIEITTGASILTTTTAPTVTNPNVLNPIQVLWSLLSMNSLLSLISSLRDRLLDVTSIHLG